MWPRYRRLKNWPKAPKQRCSSTGWKTVIEGRCLKTKEDMGHAQQ
jgi:hypothetical protein